MEEIWKGVIYQGVDYSWRLEVSNLGKLRNTKTKHIYKTSLNKQGYYQVCISLGSRGDKKIFRIHRCVAETFLENTYDKDIVVNHKNGIKIDNSVENLEFVTQSENRIHAIKIGLSVPKSGIECSSSKLSISDIKFIIENYKNGHSEFGCRALGRKFGVCHSKISNIINGKAYKNEVYNIKQQYNSL